MISRAALKRVGRGADRRDIITLEAELLDPGGLDGPQLPAPASAGAGAVPTRVAATLREQVEASQRQAIRCALAHHGDNWAAARELGLDPSNLHKLARLLGLKSLASPRSPTGIDKGVTAGS